MRENIERMSSSLRSSGKRIQSAPRQKGEFRTYTGHRGKSAAIAHGLMRERSPFR